MTDRHPITGRFLAHDCEVDCQAHCALLCGSLYHHERTNEHGNVTDYGPQFGENEDD